VRPWQEELHVPANLGEEEAIRVLQVNERGRQGRERARLMRALKKTQARSSSPSQGAQLEPTVCCASKARKGWTMRCLIVLLDRA
jgi:hypothetical protein